MIKFNSQRPSTMSLAAMAIALIALTATFGGLAVAKKKKAKVKTTTTVVSATTNDPGQISNNNNFDELTATKQCDQGTAVSGSAFFGGTPQVVANPNQLRLIDIKRVGNGYTARGSTDLDGSNLTVQVTCQTIK